MARRTNKTTSKIVPTTAADHGLTVEAGDLIHLDGKLYITHSGLLKVARRNRCNSITTELVSEQSDAAARRYVVKASVYKSSRSKPFHGFGDADPSNVSSIVRGAELRVAETRATNRALRKAYGIGLCSIEELGCRIAPDGMAGNSSSRSGLSSGAGHFTARGNETTSSRGGTLSLRDHLALLIRRHQLDPEQVKRYALAFCQVDVLRKATREQIGAFVEHLRKRAEHEYATLLQDQAATVPKQPTAVSNSQQEASA